MTWTNGMDLTQNPQGPNLVSQVDYSESPIYKGSSRKN